MDQAAAYVALALVQGVGHARLAALLAAFENDPAAVLGANRDALLAVPGIPLACACAIQDARAENGERVMDRARALGAVTLTPSDPRFPTSLRDIPDAPTLVFALGKLELLKTLSVAIVGSRSHSRYGGEVCRHLASGAARAGVTVVSGMARGLDAVAHTAALDGGGPSVGVLGNGIGVIYPSANAALYERMGEAGCLVTEFPPGERPNAGSFSRRNRLISALARVTVVVEARQKSGALVTAGCALEQGKDVLAVPGPITSPVSVGTNRLIQSGARPVLGLRDLLEAVGIAMSEDLPAVTLATGLSEGECRMLDLLSLGDEHVDVLATRLKADASEALAVLTSLEIRGLVEQRPGKTFSRVTPRIES